MEYRWSGVMGFTDDALPLVGRISERVALVGGFTGHGFSIGFSTAEALIDHLGGEPLPPHLRFDRFQRASA